MSEKTKSEDMIRCWAEKNQAVNTKEQEWIRTGDQ
jgi:hypothetical protein